MLVTEYVEPHVQTLTEKSAEAFEASKNAVKPHIINVQELADPYYQVCNTYIFKVYCAEIGQDKKSFSYDRK